MWDYENSIELDIKKNVKEAKEDEGIEKVDRNVQYIVMQVPTFVKTC